jgi:exodeoxyribonuclease V alpha subunit
VPVARLTEVFRQAPRAGSWSTRTGSTTADAGAAQGGRGERLLRGRDHEPEEGVAKLIEVVTNRIPRRFGLDPIKDVQVLCP